jgi:hypothetical protein
MLYFYVSYDATRSGVTVSSSLGSIEATGSGFNQNYGAMEYGFKFIPPDLACGAEQLRGTMVITSAADPRRFFSLPIYVNSRPC